MKEVYKFKHLGTVLGKYGEMEGEMRGGGGELHIKYVMHDTSFT